VEEVEEVVEEVEVEEVEEVEGGGWREGRGWVEDGGREVMGGRVGGWWTQAVLPYTETARARTHAHSSHA
jgi:hypothetical protein